MAFIRERNKRFSVIYDDPNVVHMRKQVSKTFGSKKEAEVFKAEMELKLLKGYSVVSQSTMTLNEYIPKFVNTYGAKNWGHKMYARAMDTLKTHIIPNLGHMQLQKVSPMVLDSFIAQLKRTKVSGSTAYNKTECDIPYLSSATVRHIYNLLKVMFDCAVKWGMIEFTPLTCDKPSVKTKEATIWSGVMMRTALDNMFDPLLHLSTHLTFICSLRSGEVAGLTWDNVDFEKEAIIIKQELQRIDIEALDVVTEKIFLKFPPKTEGSKSILVMQEPKTEGSNRKIFLPSVALLELKQRKKMIELEKQCAGENYNDYNLVFCYLNGDPIEPSKHYRRFVAWQKDNNEKFGLPKIRFHDLRHSGASYTFGVTNSIKAVQGRTGHTNAKMALGYTHELESEAKSCVQQLEGFYDNTMMSEESKIVVPIDLLIASKAIENDHNLELLMDKLKNDPLLLEKVIAGLST